MVKRVEEVKKHGGCDVSRVVNNHHSSCWCEHEKKEHFPAGSRFLQEPNSLYGSLNIKNTSDTDRRTHFKLTSDLFLGAS